MTDLTEKWKAGKLPDGNYFCKTALGCTDVFNCKDNCFFTFAVEDQAFYVKEVLAPCDYEELQRLKEENKSLIKEYQAKQIDLTNLFNENEQLRQLLKECMEEFQDFNNPSYHTVENLFTRINAVIGESEE